MCRRYTKYLRPCGCKLEDAYPASTDHPDAPLLDQWLHPAAVNCLRRPPRSWHGLRICRRRRTKASVQRLLADPSSICCPAEVVDQNEPWRDVCPPEAMPSRPLRCALHHRFITKFCHLVKRYESGGVMHPLLLAPYKARIDRCVDELHDPERERRADYLLFLKEVLGILREVSEQYGVRVGERSCCLEMLMQQGSDDGKGKEKEEVKLPISNLPSDAEIDQMAIRGSLFRWQPEPGWKESERSRGYDWVGRDGKEETLHCSSFVRAMRSGFPGGREFHAEARPIDVGPWPRPEEQLTAETEVRLRRRLGIGRY